MLIAKKKGLKVDAVLGPATGGIIVAYELARVLGARAIFAERENDVFTLRRGFEILPGEKVVVAEDVITTGGAVQEVLGLVGKAGAEVAGGRRRSSTAPAQIPLTSRSTFSTSSRRRRGSRPPARSARRASPSRSPVRARGEEVMPKSMTGFGASRPACDPLRHRDGDTQPQ